MLFLIRYFRNKAFSMLQSLYSVLLYSLIISYLNDKIKLKSIKIFIHNNSKYFHQYFCTFSVKSLILLNNFYLINKIEKIQTYHMQQLRKSRLEVENYFYVKYSAEGVTTKVNSSDAHTERACYRKVQRNDKFLEEYTGEKLYEDDYQINLGMQFNDERIIFKRLSTLYPITNRPPFFDINSPPTRPENPKNVPHCLNELGIFPTVHYRSLFLTQNFSPQGKYTVVTNVDGRFETISVDDRIPVYSDTLEPIWGVSYKNPWQLILLKVWAKKLQGYNRVQLARPFEFIQSFSNATWKYFNLTNNKLELEFIKNYRKYGGSQHAKIVLKSKDNSNIQSHGFIPNSASFQIVKGITFAKDEKLITYVAIRGTSKSAWTGSLGFLDKNVKQAFNRINPHISLEKSFIMSSEELLNNFSAAYLTSNRSDSYFTNYEIISIDASEKKAQHFEFQMPADGFFDFSIKQFPDNITAGHVSKSRISTSSVGLAVGKRYLRNKYILVRDNYASIEVNKSSLNAEHANQNQNNVNRQNLNVQDANQNHNSVINSNIHNSNIHDSSIGEYRQPRFTLYEIQYLKGYNKGEAHFLQLKKGRYILRIKSEYANIPAKYSINWVSSHRIQIKEANLSSQQKVDLLQNSIVSFMHKAPHYCLQQGKKTEMISYGNTFEEIGYGFVAVKSTKNCPYSILLEVDPEILKSQGYILKGKYKYETKLFKIQFKKGQYDSVVFKLNKNATQYFWPTKAFKVWKKEEKEIANISQPNIAITNSYIRHNEQDPYAAEAAQH